METVNKRNGGTEISDILRSQNENFPARGRLCTDQARAYNDILHCRTSKMGSHTLTCDTCRKNRTSYNSCRNRHCPPDGSGPVCKAACMGGKAEVQAAPGKVFQLRIPEKQKGLYAAMGLLKKEAYSKLWHVYIKKTFKGANQVVSYLGRYTHRVAISNSRILDTDGRTGKFRWKDYRDNKNKTMELQGAEFVRRFMQHILPRGFYKIRYYGIMASANSKTKMEDCFRLLKKTRFIFFYESLTTYEVLEEVLGEQAFICPCCKKGRMVYAIPEGKGREP